MSLRGGLKRKAEDEFSRFDPNRDMITSFIDALIELTNDLPRVVATQASGIHEASYEDDEEECKEEQGHGQEQVNARGAARLKDSQKEMEKGCIGVADAVCNSDLVIFTWRFRDLHSFLIINQQAQVVFEALIIDDLNNKMTTNWTNEPKQRYKQVLVGALMDGSIAADLKGKIEELRIESKVTPLDHDKILTEIGWTTVDYCNGYKMLDTGGCILHYKELLTKELHLASKRRMPLSIDARLRLLNFRKQYSGKITHKVQCELLRELGWSYDDFEVGKRLKYSNANYSTFNDQRVSIDGNANPITEASYISSYYSLSSLYSFVFGVHGIAIDDTYTPTPPPSYTPYTEQAIASDARPSTCVDSTMHSA